MLKPRIAIVVAEFNEDITSSLLQGALTTLAQQQVPIKSSSIFHVPGAVELPIAAQRCAMSGQYDVVIVFGAVIKGETDHYDYVAQSVTHGCQQVAIKHNVPVIFGVLTTPTRIQALDRVGGSRGHHGADAALTALKTWHALQDIQARCEV